MDQRHSWIHTFKIDVGTKVVVNQCRAFSLGGLIGSAKFCQSAAC